jgi:hypothetical protein
MHKAPSSSRFEKMDAEDEIFELPDVDDVLGTMQAESRNRREAKKQTPDKTHKAPPSPGLGEVDAEDESLEILDDLFQGMSGDIDFDEDLSFAVMNLIAAEEHLVFTAARLGEDDPRTKTVFETLRHVRDVRRWGLYSLVENPPSEIWCASKHLLAASMRFIEVANRKSGQGKLDEASFAAENAFSLWSLFWGLATNAPVQMPEERLKAVRTTMDEDTKGRSDSFLTRVKDSVKRLVDCCIE